uniref:Uncharacterized protein n=1 Tax=Ditylenchus dipsaci TaxID=166011 RepID=A0A915DU44_9BILA
MKCQASNQEKSTLMLEKEEQLRQLHERLNQINGELHEKDNMIEGQCRIDAIEKQRSIDTLNKLSAEKQEVINQLRKTSTISSRPVSMKPYCELTNQGKDARVTKMVEAGFQESDKVTMEDLADVNHRFFQYFNIEQPKKERTPIRFTDRTPSKDLIDPLLDLKLMTKWKMSWKQRELMKSDLINVLKKDFLAPNHQVRKLIKSLCEKAVYVNKTEQLDSTKEGVKVFSNATLRLCTNIKEFVEMRLNRLMRNGKLLLDGPFNGKIWLALTGDKGNEVTKLGLIIGNVPFPTQSII